jgi:hypothetical protein
MDTYIQDQPNTPTMITNYPFHIFGCAKAANRIIVVIILFPPTRELAVIAMALGRGKSVEIKETE